MGLEHAKKAAALDPRSSNTAAGLGSILLSMRRYAEARRELERGLNLSPGNIGLIHVLAMVPLAEGDLGAARAVIRNAGAGLDETALVAFFGNYFDLYWVLDERQQQVLLAAPPSAFDDDRGAWALVRAQTHHLRGQAALARAYADTAQIEFGHQLEGIPDDAQRHVLRGLALAYMGRKTEAIEEGRRGVARTPVSRDAQSGPYFQHQLVRIYLLLGEPEQALDQLEPLLRIPYYLSPGWLRIDPNFAPLKGNPRFEKLIAGS